MLNIVLVIEKLQGTLKKKAFHKIRSGFESHLIGSAQVCPILVQHAVAPFGLLPLLPGLDCGVAPHVGAAVGAGDV